MNGLTLLIYLIAAPTLAGISLAAALAAGADTANPVMISVAIGALVAIPVAWLVARKLQSVKGLTK